MPTPEFAEYSAFRALLKEGLIYLMADPFRPIRQKVNHAIASLATTGFILLLLSFMIVWFDFLLRLIVGMIVVILAYSFLFWAYKLHTIKKDLEKFWKL